MHDYILPVAKDNLCWLASHGDIEILESLGNSIFKVFLRTDVKPEYFDETIRKYASNKTAMPRIMLHG